MAVHPSLESLLRESLPEYLYAAGECLRRQKVGGGVYGFPAALLLLCIADAIGSYHRGNKSFLIRIDNAETYIDGERAKHFYILNSGYYSQSLTRKQIERFYDYYRCLLAHNASLANECKLQLNDAPEPFEIGANGWVRGINLKSFYSHSEIAVRKFLSQLESVLPKSAAANVIGKKP